MGYEIEKEHQKKSFENSQIWIKVKGKNLIIVKFYAKPNLY